MSETDVEGATDQLPFGGMPMRTLLAILAGSAISLPTANAPGQIAGPYASTHEFLVEVALTGDS